MTTHDYSIDNQTFPAFRSDLNNALAAILSMNSNTSAPSTTIAGMLWYDTTNGLIKQRNSADSGWITLFAIGKQGLIDQNGSTVYAADSVGTDSYAITLSPAITAYAESQVFRFKAGTANTGAATLNVNGVGAVSIKKGYNLDLATGDILANQIVEVIYNGTNFQMLSQVSNLISFFESSEQTITFGASITVSHGFSGKPKLVHAVMINKTTEFGYSVGDEAVPISVGDLNPASAQYGYVPTADTTNIVIPVGTQGIRIVRKDTFAGGVITAGNWKIIARAWQ